MRTLIISIVTFLIGLFFGYYVRDSKDNIEKEILETTNKRLMLENERLKRRLKKEEENEQEKSV